MSSTKWGICLGLLLASLGVEVRSVRAQQMPALPAGVRIVLARCERIVKRKALLEQLRIEKGRVVRLSWGAGNP